MADEVVAAYASALFIRSEADIRRPVVLLTGERTNVYGVLEKHFRETALPPSERFWRTVRTQWTPMLDTWRPRVNGVQLKVLSGARLPESEEEWSVLHAALAGVCQHLRADTSVERLMGELRDFVGMVVDWWQNRKKTEGGNGTGNCLSSVGLMQRVASSGLLLGGMGLPLAKRQCTGGGGSGIGYLQLTPVPQPVSPVVYQSTIYAAPEIVQHTLLAGSGGSGRLPDRLGLMPPPPPPPLPPPPGNEALVMASSLRHYTSGQLPAHQVHMQDHDGSGRGGTGYLQHLTSNNDAQLFGHLFPGGGGGGGSGGGAGGSGGMADDERGGSQSPRDGSGGHLVQQDSALLPPLGGPLPGASSGGAAGNGCYPHSPRPDRQEGSAENKEPSRPSGAAPGPAAAAAQPAAAAAPDSKCFVSLNVGGFCFLTTAATLAAVEGSYFSKLAQQAAAAAAKARSAGSGSGSAATAAEYFVDRSGKIFEYVLDYLRSQRFGDSSSTLPRDERTLHLLAREADFYQLPDLADRARTALVTLAAATAGPLVEDTPSDVPASTALEGSAHGGQLMAARPGAAGQQHQQLLPNQQQPTVLDALFVETGFQEPANLATAQAAVLEKLNAMVQAKQVEGFAVVEFKCGSERESDWRNLHYHVLLRKAAAAAPSSS